VNYFRYASPVAFTRAHFAYLLSESQWRDLLRSESVDAFPQRLEETAYAEKLELDQRGGRRIDEIERAISTHWAEAARAPMVFTGGSVRELLEWQWRLFEVDNLKIVLRGVDQAITPEAIRASLIPLPADTSVEWEALLDLSAIPSVVDQLENTPYGPMLEPAVEIYHGEMDRFVLEIALDLGYNRELLHSIRKVRGKDRVEAERFVGNVIDSRMLIWSDRFRFFADVQPEQILNYILGHGVRVGAEDIKSIATVAHTERLPGISLQRFGFDLTAMRACTRQIGLHHAHARAYHAERRHHPSHSRPDRLHHRGADRARKRSSQ
jgi:V/A-type H+-transporting ATPase subunit C